ncbi:MAG: MBL fold metallo-hydrolase [Bacteroidaceae bacterium]|nr:MBL fold metallo-hydrolase [Bacteroidaceae bacterium]
MLTVRTFTFNPLGENTYVLSDATGQAAIIDCGALFDDERLELARYIEEQGLHPVRHLLTHAHFDHLFGAQFLADAYDVHPELCLADAETYRLQPQQLRLFLHRDLPLEQPEPRGYFADGDTIAFGAHTLRVIHTPGHTPGGVCFHCPEEQLLLSGDNLFRGSIGRCDLPGSDPQALPAALRAKVLTLPPATRVLPGHGPETTVANELGNPYL